MNSELFWKWFGDTDRQNSFHLKRSCVCVCEYACVCMLVIQLCLTRLLCPCVCVCCVCVCVCVLVAQSCPTLCDPMDYSSPGSSVHRILQARILEWVAIPFSGDRNQVSRLQVDSLLSEPPAEPWLKGYQGMIRVDRSEWQIQQCTWGNRWSTPQSHSATVAYKARALNRWNTQRENQNMKR